MTATHTRRSRWMVPVAVTALVAGTTLTVAMTAAADEPVPTAAELLTGVQQPTVSALSGTVVTRGDLGLPAVPAALDIDGPFSLNDEQVTAQVWSSGPEAQRITIGSGEDEVTAIHDDEGMLIWSAADNAVTWVRAEDDLRSMMAGKDQPPRTPADIADEVLSAVSEDSAVSVGNAADVAGRATYELVLTPNDPATLVERVTVAVDSKTYVPLRVQVFSNKLADPAFESGFTEIDYAEPPASAFDLDIPTDATITERTLSAEDKPQVEKPDVQVVGDGWSAVAVGQINVGELMSNATEAKEASGEAIDPQAAAELAMTFMSLPRLNGEWGTGRVIEGTLFSVLITDDGRYAVGAVDATTLADVL